MSTPTAIPTVLTDENRDLGFGAVVSQRQQLRLLNKDGSFNVSRTGMSFWSSLSVYHALLRLSWTRFFALITAAYLVANGFFAGLYSLCGPHALVRTAGPPLQPPFLEAFFFSVETLSTIGFGNIVPVTTTANVIVMIEAMCGLLGLALATGMVFSRFAQPTAKIVFSRNAVIAPYRDITAFEFRIANARNNQLVDLEAKLILSRFELRGGQRMRQYYQLALERSTVAFFPLSWTIVHPIDKASPIYGLSRQEMMNSQAEVLILLQGLDETFAQTVHARSSYVAEEILWGHKFLSLFRGGDSQRLTIDMARLHATEPVRDGDTHAAEQIEIIYEIAFGRMPNAERQLHADPSTRCARSG